MDEINTSPCQCCGAMERDWSMERKLLIDGRIREVVNHHCSFCGNLVWGRDRMIHTELCE